MPPSPILPPTVRMLLAMLSDRVPPVRVTAPVPRFSDWVAPTYPKSPAQVCTGFASVMDAAPASKEPPDNVN